MEPVVIEVDAEAAVGRYFDAVNADRFYDVAAMFSDTAQFTAPIVGILRGPAAIAGYIRSAVRGFAEHRDEPVRMHVAGATVTAEIRFTGRLVSGAPIAFDAVDVIELAPDGRICRIANFYDAVTVGRELAALRAVEGPLDGVRVLDLSRLLPGGFATAVLGDLGAEVVKIEQPGAGDPMRTYEPRVGDGSAFSWVVDRNKRSVALNLRDERGVAALLALARRADIVVESFRPGVADRLGVGYDAVARVNPGIVYCSISGYGADGPLAQTAGHDLNYVGRAGLLSLSGVGGEPALPATQVADLGGALMGVAGLLAALVRARETGLGDHVDISMTDAALALAPVSVAAFLADGRVPAIETELLNGRYPCYNLYACADGRHITVGPLEPPFWQALCEGAGRPDLLATQYDPGALSTWRAIFATATRDEWLERFAGSDACVGPVNDLREALADPQLRHRRMVVESGDEPAQVGSPVKLRTAAGGAPAGAPALGEGTRALLAAAGYDDDALDRLIADGVVQAG